MSDSSSSSGVSVSTVNGVMRMTGMNTGLDVDSIVAQLMKAENTKVDKLKAEKTKLQWKQEAYRDFITQINNLKSTYFDVLNTNTYMLSANSFSSFDTTSSPNSAATATGYAGAVNGTYNIKNITIATKASVAGGNGNVAEGSNAISSTVKAGDFTQNLSLNVDGNNYNIDLGTSDYSSVSALAAAINSKLASTNDASDSTGKIKLNKKVSAAVSADGLSISLSATKESTLTSSLTDNKMNLKMNVDDTNNKFTVNVTDKAGTVLDTKTVQIAKGSYDSVDAYKTAVNDALTAAGVNTKLEARVSTDGNRIQLVNKDSANSLIRITSSEGAAKGVSSLGFSSTGFQVETLGTTRMSSLFTDSASKSLAFTVNGHDFNFDFSKGGADENKTVSQVLNTISSQAGVKLSYSELGGSFRLESNITGSNQALSGSDTSGNFLKTILGSGADGYAKLNSKTYGTDAKATITDPNGIISTVTEATNAFSIDGVSYNLLADDTSTAGVNISLSQNVDNTLNKIKDFVTKYNTLITNISAKLSEKKDLNYSPLTDDQKKSMTQDQITQWETKAKKGTLRNDNMLQSMLYSLRDAFYDPVKVKSTDASGTNIGISFSDIGLSTSDDQTQGGTIIIDEAKLKKAISTKGDMIGQLFTKTSDTQPSYDADANSTQRSARYNEEGIFQRMSDILADNTRTTRNANGQKGLLLVQAGVTGDFSELNNVLSSQISDKDDEITALNEKLTEKQQNYYTKFSNLESVMQQYNTQSSWLTSQLSS